MNILFAQGAGAAGGFGDADGIVKMIMAYAIVLSVIGVVVGLLVIVSGWKLFSKAGEPGWAIFVPIYNIIVMLKISGKPAWWFFLFLCPPVGAIMGIIANIGLARNFGKGTGFAVGLIFLPIIFFPLLAFGDARYSPVDDMGRPMGRRGRDDYDDDYDDRPKRRRRDEEDDYDDRPRRR